MTQMRAFSETRLHSRKAGTQAPFLSFMIFDSTGTVRTSQRRSRHLPSYYSGG